MKKATLFFGVFVLLFFGCDNFTSKQTILDKINEVDRLHDIAGHKTNDSTLFYITKAKNIIKNNIKLPDTLLIENNFRKGCYFKELNKIDSASYYFHRTIDLIKKPNNRKRNLIYFQYTWETDEANGKIANATNAAQLFIDITNENVYPDDVLYAYNSLERIHKDLFNFEKALYYNSKGLETAKKSLNLDMFVITGNSRADMLSIQGEHDTAFKLLDSLKTIKVGPDAKRQLYRTYGISNFYQGTYVEAIINYNISLNLTKDISENSNYNLIESYNNIAEAYLEYGDYKIANKYLDSTQHLIKPNSHQDYVNFYNELRFKLHYRTNKSETKLIDEYLKLKSDIKNQHETKINEKLMALSLSNEKEKRAIKESKESEIKNIKLAVLLTFSGLLLLLGYVFYRYKRNKFEKQYLQMQQRLLRLQMNSHFMFNTLSVIQNHIKKNQEESINYLLKFSRLLRLVLENSINNYVQVENELELLGKYIDLQLLHFPKKFSYNVILENFKNDDLLFIPPMLIQPFIENSIEHGFSGINYTGHIDIKLKLENKYIACSIEDNGTGLKESNNNYKKSVSTKLIIKFIKKQTNSSILIQDKKERNIARSGVLVKFLIPYKLSEND
jgi:hypothetical protein